MRMGAPRLAGLLSRAPLKVGTVPPRGCRQTQLRTNAPAALDATRRRGRRELVNWMRDG
jgi:hypothetical protein